MIKDFSEMTENSYKVKIESATAGQRQKVADLLLIHMAGIVSAFILNNNSPYIRYHVKDFRGSVQPGPQEKGGSLFRNLINLAFDFDVIKRATAVEMLSVLNRMKNEGDSFQSNFKPADFGELFSQTPTFRSLLSARLKNLFDSFSSRNENDNAFYDAISSILSLVKMNDYREDTSELTTVLRSGGYLPMIAAAKIAKSKNVSKPEKNLVAPGRNDMPIEDLDYRDRIVWRFDTALDNGKVDDAVEAVEDYLSAVYSTSDLMALDLVADINVQLNGLGYIHKSYEKSKKTLGKVIDILFNLPGLSKERDVSFRLMPEYVVDYKETADRLLKKTNKEDLTIFSNWLLFLSSNRTPFSAGEDRKKLVEKVISIYTKVRENNNGVLDNAYVRILREFLTPQEIMNADGLLEDAGMSYLNNAIKEAAAGKLKAKTFKNARKNTRSYKFVGNLAEKNPGRAFEEQLAVLADSSKDGAQAVYNYISDVSRLSPLPKNVVFPTACKLIFDNFQVRGVWWDAIANISKRVSYERAYEIFKDAVLKYGSIKPKSELNDFIEAGARISSKFDAAAALSMVRRESLLSIAANTPIKSSPNPVVAPEDGSKTMADPMSSGKVDAPKLANMDLGTKINAIMKKIIDEALKTGKAPVLDTKTTFKFPEDIDVGSLHFENFLTVLMGYDNNDIQKFLKILVNATNRHAMFVGEYLGMITRYGVGYKDRLPKLEMLTKAKYMKPAVGSTKSDLLFKWWTAVKKITERDPSFLNVAASEINALTGEARNSVLEALEYNERELLSTRTKDISWEDWKEFKSGTPVDDFKDQVAEALSVDRREKLTSVATQNRRDEPERRRM